MKIIRFDSCVYETMKSCTTSLHTFRLYEASANDEGTREMRNPRFLLC